MLLPSCSAPVSPSLLLYLELHFISNPCSNPPLLLPAAHHHCSHPLLISTAAPSAARPLYRSNRRCCTICSSTENSDCHHPQPVPSGCVSRSLTENLAAPPAALLSCSSTAILLHREIVIFEIAGITASPAATCSSPSPAVSSLHHPWLHHPQPPSKFCCLTSTCSLTIPSATTCSSTENIWLHHLQPP